MMSAVRCLRMPCRSTGWSEGEVGVSAPAVDDLDGRRAGPLGGEHSPHQPEEFVDLPELALHRRPHLAGGADYPETLKEAVPGFGGDQVVLGAVVREVGRPLGEGRLCSRQRRLALLGEAQVEVAGGGLEVELPEGQGEQLVELRLGLGAGEVLRGVLLAVEVGELEPAAALYEDGPHDDFHPGRVGAAELAGGGEAQEGLLVEGGVSDG